MTPPTAYHLDPEATAALGHTIDPETKIWPISEWGSSCARGFVSDSRFAGGNEQVIKLTNRNTTHEWRKTEPHATV